MTNPTNPIEWAVNTLARSDEPSSEKTLFMLRGQVMDMGQYRSVANGWIGGLQSRFSLDNTTLAYAYAVGVIAWACSTKKATILSQMPLVVKDADKHTLDTSPAQQFIENRSQFLYLIQVSYDLFGKVYLRKRYNAHGFPSALEWLNPLDVYELYDHHARKVIGYQYLLTGERLADSEVIADYLFNPINAFDGISPFEVAMTNIRAERNIREFGAAFFLNNALPSGFLTIKDAPDDKMPELRKRWREQHAGPKNAHRMEFSNKEVSFQQVTPPPIDLAMQELNDMTARDTCIAFDVNPLLIGLSIASDALSAQSTYDGVKRDHIENVAIPRLARICEVLNQQWLAVDFPAGDYTLAPDHAALLANTLGTAERSTTAAANVASGIFGINDGREYLGRDPIEGHLDRNPQWAIEAWQAGGITFNEFRLALGKEILEDKRGLFIWDIDPRAMPAATPFSLGEPSPTQAPQLPPPPESPPAPEAPEQLADETGNSLAVVLNLANHPDLVALQKRLRALYPQDVEWTPAGEFHITLTYAPHVDDESAARVAEALQGFVMPDLRLNIGSLYTFDDLGQYALHFRIRRNAALLELQAALYDVFEECGVSCSAYSLPTAYKPHITMGYVTGQKPSAITFASKITVQPATLQLSHEIAEGDYKVILEVSPEGVIAEEETADNIEETRAALDAQLDELRKWHKRIKNTRKPDASFEARVLPPEVSAWVQHQLSGYWNPALVFESATRWIREGHAPEPFGAAPEEVTDYWHHFDDLKADLGADWLAYMRDISGAVIAAISADPQADLEDIFAAGHDALVGAWVGTAEQRGPLTALVMAGMAAGNAALNRASTRAVEFAVDWEQQAVDALEFARGYGFDLITRIDDTTRAEIQKIITEWLATGGTVDQLADLLAKVFPPDNPDESPAPEVIERARLIAVTESAILYNEGAFRRWEAAGVTKATWQNVRDEHVCKVCRPLHGQVADIAKGWTSPYTRKTYRASAHPRCRCFRRPIVE